MSKTIDCLNEAFRRDPVAMHALASNSVPCTLDLLDDEYIEVNEVPTLHHGLNVGMLGVLNGVLMANGLPLVELDFQHTKGLPSKIVGFKERAST